MKQMYPLYILGCTAQDQSYHGPFIPFIGTFILILKGNLEGMLCYSHHAIIIYSNLIGI